MEVLPIPVEDDGMDVAALEAACAGGRVPRLLYTIPNFQNPSGATLSAAKRAALAEVCDRFGILVLEDDPYGKLRFEGEALPGLFESGGPGPGDLHLLVLEDRGARAAGGLSGGPAGRVGPPGRGGVAHLHLPRPPGPGARSTRSSTAATCRATSPA